MAVSSRWERKRELWPLVVTALALAAFFHSMLTLSKVPWIGDIKSYYCPAWRYLSHAFRSGGPSLWCPGIYCGFPLFADSEMGLFYPINLLFFQLPATAGFNYSIVLHYLLGAVFTYAYCRRLRLGRSASLFASLPFTLGGSSWPTLCIQTPSPPPPGCPCSCTAWKGLSRKAGLPFTLPREVWSASSASRVS